MTFDPEAFTRELMDTTMDDLPSRVSFFAPHGLSRPEYDRLVENARAGGGDEAAILTALAALRQAA